MANIKKKQNNSFNLKIFKHGEFRLCNAASLLLVQEAHNAEDDAVDVATEESIEPQWWATKGKTL